MTRKSLGGLRPGNFTRQQHRSNLDPHGTRALPSKRPAAPPTRRLFVPQPPSKATRQRVLAGRPSGAGVALAGVAAPAVGRRVGCCLRPSWWEGGSGKDGPRGALPNSNRAARVLSDNNAARKSSLMRECSM
ncbi:hypothetical protein CALCODRAFT_320838 [Calocera cornea HHB12733]|uniref:Uncharacterized protein n=1 Tax=Calocera cornea HHB12733 TaxID=1353952 RepID=A0A165F619_9BASI|nr:hypothetical protein CALCODRAFT_320838 [Calocera cornea HHB12733]